MHSLLGTINAIVAPVIFLQVTTNLSDHPHEVDPMNSLQALKTSINNRFARFLLKSAIESIVKNFKVDRFTVSTTCDDGTTTEPLAISSIPPSAVAAGFSTGSFFVAEWSQVVDVVRRDVGTGCLGVYGKQEAGQEQRFDHLIIIQCKYPHGIIIRYLAATKFVINVWFKFYCWLPLVCYLS